MAYYYVNQNAQPTGEHEVHKRGCPVFPAEENLTYLGNFKTCHPAVRKARKHYTNVDGCAFCSEACHTR